MRYLKVIALLTFVVITYLSTVGADAFAATVMSQNGTKRSLPLELKNLPMILDSKTIDFEKIKNQVVEPAKTQKSFGTESGGGGNMCAQNLVVGANFIVENVALLPFSDSERAQFIQKMGQVLFLQGENLEFRGQAVDAINYPAIGVIVASQNLCVALEDKKMTSYSLLLHEYLGVAGMNDTTYQISGPFSQKVAELLADMPDMGQLRTAAIKAFESHSKTRQRMSQLRRVGLSTLDLSPIQVSKWGDYDYLFEFEDGQGNVTSTQTENRIEFLVLQPYSLASEHWSQHGKFGARVSFARAGKGKFVLRNMKFLKFE